MFSGLRIGGAEPPGASRSSGVALLKAANAFGAGFEVNFPLNVSVPVCGFGCISQ